MVFSVQVELDVQVESDDDAEQVAMAWFDDGSRRFLGATRDRLDHDEAPPWKDPDDPTQAWGPPDAVWGSLMVSRTDHGGPPRHSTKPATAKGFRWLAGQVRYRPFNALVRIHQLDSAGMPTGDHARLNLRFHQKSPGWVQLTSSLPSIAFEPRHGYQQRWLALLRWQAERWNPSYGQIGVRHAGDCTTLESRLPVDFGRNQPGYTLGESRQWLRGYAWVTILAEELAQRLGGVPAIAASGDFHEVAQLATGGVWIQATEEFSTYDQTKAAQLFGVLAPVLRPGRPTPAPSPPSEPHLLVYEDAAERAAQARRRGAKVGRQGRPGAPKTP